VRALSEFRAPEPNLAVIAFCQFLIPLYCRYIDHFTCQFTDDKNTVAALKNKRTIILLNHADRQDPSVVVFLAKYLQEQVHCMVAREVFDWYHGVLGWFFQKFGCYSVNRGAGDIKSIETTKANSQTREAQTNCLS
jgi:1-acyl-sn-glycerol-3-phosphate acyltransferase